MQRQRILVEGIERALSQCSL